MFTAAEFRLIRENCLSDLQKLLSMLNIKEPNWQSGDEFVIYEKLDDEIVERVCRLMKSESVIEGYTNLMTFGGLHFNYSETDNELLATILQNQNAVKRGATQSVTVQQTTTEMQPQKVTKTVERKVMQPLFIVVGIALIIAGVALSNSIGIIGAAVAGLIGFGSLGLGINGKKLTARR